MGSSTSHPEHNNPRHSNTQPSSARERRVNERTSNAWPSDRFNSIYEERRINEQILKPSVRSNFSHNRINQQKRINEPNENASPSASINQQGSVSEPSNPGVRQGVSQIERNRSDQPTVSHDAANSERRTEVASFNDDFVRMALQECGCDSVLQIFIDNEIDKDALMLLNEEDLKDLMPTKLGPRKKLWAFIQNHQLDTVSSTSLASKAQTVHDSVIIATPPIQSLQLTEYVEDHQEYSDGTNNALAAYSPDIRSEHSYKSDEENFRTFTEPPQSLVNNLSFNLQFVKQNYNQRTYNTVESSSRTATHQNTTSGTVERKKPMESKPKKREHNKFTSHSAVSQQTKWRNESNHNVFTKNKQLPIFEYKNHFLKMVEQNAVVIVIAETGSGKSTQMPQYLARANYDKKIICTQPRRLAAKSLAKRVAFEHGTNLGREVGYRVRFDNCSENTTKIIYVTEGVLVHELAADVTASNYSVVIIDEAHERNLNTDVLLGCLKKAIALRPDLKVVISSATVEANKFSKFFDYAPVLDIPGRSYPVTIHYTSKPDPDYLTAVIDRVCSLHSASTSGDILAFLPGQEEIEQAAETITNRIRYQPNSFFGELVLPLYSKLPSEQQQLIFDPAPPNTRKIILATNIAETSLTIDGIVFVVDSGMVKQAEYVTKANGNTLECTTLVTIPITKAQANQRSGRAGRTQPGVAYRLYSEDAYHKMAASPIPEILRGNLEMVVLLLFSMGVKDILEFDFLDSPPKDALLTAIEKLQEFGAISKSTIGNEYTLTSIGKQMSGFPIEPYLSKMLIMSAGLGCSEEMLTIIAILSAQVDKLFKRPKKKKMEADLKKNTFHCPEGDHITLLNVYNQWLQQPLPTSRAWCKEFYLDFRILEEVYEIRQQLSTMLDEKNISRKSCGDDMTKVQIAIASGSFRKIAWKKSKYTYFTYSSPRDDPVLIHPSSVLFSAAPCWVIYNSIIKTKKAYMSQVLTIELDFIKEYAPEFYSKLANVI